MEHAMDEVAGEFGGPGEAEAAGLDDGLGRAEEDFAVEVQGGIEFTVIEGDDVGGAVMVEPAAVESDHLGEGEEVQAEGVGVELELMFEEVAGGAEEGGDLDGASALAVAYLDLVHGTVLPRCSS
jgi:hypothetical protein